MLLVFTPLWSTESQPAYKLVGLLEYLNALNTRPLLGIYIDPKELEWTVQDIKTKFFKANNPLRFVDSIIRIFRSAMDVEDSLITHQVYLTKINYCCNVYINLWKNENRSKDFVKKFHYFTNAKYHISINWITKKVNSLFLSQEVCAFDYVLSSGISWEIILQANKIGTGHFQ